MNRMDEAVVVLHPPAQIGLADLDELRLCADFRGGRLIQRKIDRVDSSVWIVRVHNRSLTGSRSAPQLGPARRRTKP